MSSILFFFSKKIAIINNVKCFVSHAGVEPAFRSLELLALPMY